MGLVVLGEDEPLLVGSAEGLRHRPRQEQLLADPERQGLAERAEARRGVGEVGFQEPLELEQGLVVEADPVEVGGGQAGLGQAVVDGLRGEGGSCFLRVNRSS